MPPKSLLLTTLLLPFLLASARAAEIPTTTGLLAEGDDNSAKLAQTLGDNGILLIKSQTRWDALQKLSPEFKPDKELPNINFAKQSLLLIYAHPRRPGDSLKLSNSDPTAKTPEYEFTLTWRDDGEEQKEMRNTIFILAIIPATDSAKVTLFTEGKVAAKPIQEFQLILGDKNGGDWIDNLQPAIETKSPKIAAGEDILIDFTLHNPKIPADKLPEGLNAEFNQAPKSVYVWDGKYSGGYRNHSFLVTTPDGKTQLLRDEVIRDWDKDAPSPEEITAAKPYHLPTWTDDDAPKSLQKLGLDTSKPGTYTITGIYEELAGGPGGVAKRRTAIMWSGSAATNTLTIEVK